MNHVVYLLITNKMCTYSELKTTLTIDDMLDLFEVMIVHLHNKTEAMKGS